MCRPANGKGECHLIMSKNSTMTLSGMYLVFPHASILFIFPDFFAAMMSIVIRSSLLLSPSSDGKFHVVPVGIGLFCCPYNIGFGTGLALFVVNADFYNLKS